MLKSAASAGHLQLFHEKCDFASVRHRVGIVSISANSVLRVLRRWFVSQRHGAVSPSVDEIVRPEIAVRASVGHHHRRTGPHCLQTRQRVVFLHGVLMNEWQIVNEWILDHILTLDSFWIAFHFSLKLSVSNGSRRFHVWCWRSNVALHHRGSNQINLTLNRATKDAPVSE